MNGIKVLLIDVDNTLLDFDACVKLTLSNLYEEYSLGEFKDEYVDVFNSVNNKLWQSLERGEIDIVGLKKVRFGLVMEKLGVPPKDIDYEGYFRKTIHECTIPVEGAYEFLERLSAKYLIGVASNGPYDQQVYRLNKGDMAKYITYYFVSSKIGASKPSNAFFSKAFEELEGYGKDEVIMIGDSLTSDIKGGNDYGLKTIFFNKHKLKEIDSPIVPDHKFDTLKEIADFLLE